MSESQYRAAYLTGKGDGIHEERARFRRTERPLWFTFGLACGLAAMTVFALLGRAF